MRIWLLLILLTSFKAFGQIDQLNAQQLKTVVEGDTVTAISKIEAYSRLVRLERNEVHDTVVVDYYLQMARLSSIEQDFQSSVDYCDTILTSFQELDFYVQKEVEVKKAMYYRSAGKMDECLPILLRVLGEYEDNGDYKESAALNNRIGIIFLKMDDYENAQYHLEESIEHAQRVGDKGMEASSLMSLGNRYKSEERFAEAEEKYKASIAIAKQEGFQRTLAGNYNNYGSLLRLMNNPDQAMGYYKKAVQINQEIGNDKWLSYNYNNLGNILKGKKQYERALDYFMKSNEIKQKLDDAPGMVYTMFNIADLYKEMGNYQLAYDYYEKHAKLKDSVEAMNSRNLSKRLAAEFQAEKREAKIGQLHMEQELNKQQLKARDERIVYQNFVGWLLGIGVVLVLIIAIVLWRNVLSRKKINAELRSKNEQIDKQHNEIIDSINYAKRIQNAILPSTEKMNSICKKWGVFYRPKDIVSGDFYVCDENDQGIYFGTVDCTGHGVPGAMVSLVASSHFNKMLHELHLVAPGDILKQLNAEVPEALDSNEDEISDGMDMALCRLDKANGKLHFAGAYQNCWLIISTDSLDSRRFDSEFIRVHNGKEVSVVELKGNRYGIGSINQQSDFRTIEVDIQQGDKVLLSTDGYQDQFGGPNNKKFKVKEMRNVILNTSPKASTSDLITLLETEMTAWQGQFEQVDDICVMVVEI